MELNPGYKRTKIGAIPEEWNLPLLDSVAKRGSGHTPDKKHPEYWNGPIKWMSLKDSDALDNLYIEDTAATITPAGIKHSSAVIHPAGTVILSRDAGVGKSAITKDDMAVSQHFMAWQCGPHLDNHFLYYWLQAAKPEFERIAIGNTIKTIGLPYFRGLRVPCPPLAEQRAIAAALGAVDALLGGLIHLIAKKRDLKQAAMQQLLTGQTRLTGFRGEWDVRTLATELDRLEAGVSVNSVDEAHRIYADERSILKTSAVTNGRFLPNEAKIIAPRDIGRAQLSPRADTIIISRMNTPDLVGECGYVERDFPDLFLPDRLWMTRIRQGSEVCVRWLGYLLSSETYKRRLKAAATGTSGSMKNLSKHVFLSQPIPFPGGDEQRAIAAALADVDAEVTALEQRLAKTGALKQGMMQELLTGRTRLV